MVVVYHGDTPMERNLDHGGGRMLARAAERAGVTMLKHSRAESVLLHTRDDGRQVFSGLVCADGKQVGGDLLVLSCGVTARAELASQAGLATARGILVDEELRSWTDPDIFAIGDCAHVAPRGEADAPVPGGPSGLVGPGWRQADWLAQVLLAEAAGARRPALLEAESSGVVMLKSEGVNVVAAGRDRWATRGMTTIARSRSGPTRPAVATSRPSRATGCSKASCAPGCRGSPPS